MAKRNDLPHIEADTNHPTSAERDLLSAILMRAIADVVGDATLTKSEITKARRWMFLHKKMPSDLESIPFTFPWICLELGLDPNKIRTGLLRGKIKLGSHAVRH